MYTFPKSRCAPDGCKYSRQQQELQQEAVHGDVNEWSALESVEYSLLRTSGLYTSWVITPSPGYYKSVDIFMLQPGSADSVGR